MVHDVDTAQMWMLPKGDGCFLDDERRKVNLQIQNHVVHPQRIGILLDVQPDWFFVHHYPTQHEPVVCHVIGANFVSTRVDTHVVGLGWEHLHVGHPDNANDADRVSRTPMPAVRVHPSSYGRSCGAERSQRELALHA